MNIKKLLNNKKFKNIFITIIEIIVVSGIIFGVLMYFQKKVSNEADKAGSLNGKGLKAENKKKSITGSGEYFIEVNKKLNSVTVYQYSKNKKSKTAYKVFRCSAGENLTKGKYKISDSDAYSWININGGWHKYNTKFGEKSWIQSSCYKEKYSYTLNKNSYKAIGKEQKSGSCLMLTAGDAAWIYENCKAGTVVSVINGNAKNKLPIAFENKEKAQKYCGWDPTDPDKDNPYNKSKNGAVTLGVSTVFIEKGYEPHYTENLLALDIDGSNLTGRLKYKKINTDETGEKNITFKCKLSSGKIIKTTCKFKIIDTIPPKVSCAGNLFTYEVASKDKNDMNKESNVTDITNMVRTYASTNEADSKISVYTVGKDELDEGKFPVVIKAQDSAGNIGSCQVMVEIKVKTAENRPKYKPSKDVENKRKKKAGMEKSTTKKAENSKKEHITKKNLEKTDENNTDKAVIE